MMVWDQGIDLTIVLQFSDYTEPGMSSHYFQQLFCGVYSTWLLEMMVS